MLLHPGLPPALAPLAEAAERDSLRIAALARGASVLALFVFFHLARPAELPGAFVMLVSIGLALLFASAPLTLRLARAARFRRSLAGLLTGLDLAVLLGLMIATGRLLDLPVALLSVQPPFMLLFLFLALGALRQSPATVLAVTLAAVGYLLAVALLQEPEPASDRLPIFSSGANLIRAAAFGATGLVLALGVVRARHSVIEALAVGQRASNLARYLPHGIAEQLGRDGLAALSRGREQRAAVLFADIVGFTALAEPMEARAVGALLTQVRTIQRRAIEDAGGFVDKFIGDAVMGVFGVPGDQGNPARQALSAAAAMTADLEAWNQQRDGRNEFRLAFGIGIHYGTVFAGAVGDEQRLEFAVLGDTVNVAQRCEALTRELGEPLLVSRQTIEAAGEDRESWRPIGIDHLRGRSGRIDLLAPA